jgi:hypothetical protein
VFSLLHSSFQQVLMLDCDLVPLADPARLFDAPDYAANRNLFWPDAWQNWVSPEIYDIVGLTPDVVVGGWSHEVHLGDLPGSPHGWRRRWGRRACCARAALPQPGR